MTSERYVFISYSSKNQEKADSVRKLLIEEGISCWMAPYDIPAGSKYAHVINDALENCSCFILLLTNASQESQYVEREVERAIAYKKVIIPVQLESLELNSGFKFYIGSSQIIAVPKIDIGADEVKRVIDGIQNCIRTTEEKEVYQYKQYLKGEENILLLSSVDYKLIKIIKQITIEDSKGDCEIAYAQEWTNDLIDSIRTDKHHEYEDKYINTGVLVMDGIELLAFKESTQEELAYILRKRMDVGRKTVLVSSSSFDNLRKTLDSKLYSIVCSGITIEK